MTSQFDPETAENNEEIEKYVPVHSDVVNKLILGSQTVCRQGRPAARYCDSHVWWGLTCDRDILGSVGENARLYT